MLLNSLEHIAFRLAGLTTVIYGLEKTRILENFIGENSGDISVALKTSAILSGSEFLSDHLLSFVTHTKVPSLWTSINQLGMVFVSNALVLMVLDKLGIDDMIVKRGASDEMKAAQLALLFVLVQEITMKFLQMYSSKMLSY